MKNIIKPIILIGVLYFMISWIFDNTCNFDGCEQDAIGWKKSSECSGYSYSVCRPLGSTSGGYCSKNHAIKDN